MITKSYDDRSRMFLWREVINTGTLLALLIIPTILAINFDFDRRQQVTAMGMILLVVLPLSVLLAVLFVPDPPPTAKEQNVKLDWAAVKTAFTDPTMLKIIAVEILVGIAIAGTGGTFLFAAQWGFGVTNLAPVILMVFFIAGFAAMPFWIWLSKRTEKHIAFIATCVWSMVMYLVYLPLSTMGGGVVYLLIAAMAGRV